MSISSDITLGISNGIQTAFDYGFVFYLLFRHFVLFQCNKGVKQEFVVCRALPMETKMQSVWPQRLRIFLVTYAYFSSHIATCNQHGHSFIFM